MSMFDALDYQTMVDGFGFTELVDSGPPAGWPTPCSPEDEAVPYQELTDRRPLHTEDVILYSTVTTGYLTITVAKRVIRTTRRTS